MRKTFPGGISAHGADALRMGLLSCFPLADHTNFNMSSVINASNFEIKLYNATKWLCSTISSAVKNNVSLLSKGPDVLLIEKFMYSKIALLASSMIRNMTEDYHMDKGLKSAQSFTIDTYCNIYVEFSKLFLANKKDDRFVHSRLYHLISIFSTVLKLLHPFCPHITEARDDRTHGICFSL